jgi:hypothetical protein
MQGCQEAVDARQQATLTENVKARGSRTSVSSQAGSKHCQHRLNETYFAGVTQCLLLTMRWRVSAAGRSTGADQRLRSMLLGLPRFTSRGHVRATIWWIRIAVAIININTAAERFKMHILPHVLFAALLALWDAVGVPGPSSGSAVDADEVKMYGRCCRCGSCSCAHTRAFASMHHRSITAVPTHSLSGSQTHA